ncbi:MAG: hypothetical protein IH613_08700, partial [Desulfuromonadales bacterium]|nr:hypothetical protein [Desulfuromonadales bacterium]
MPVKKSARKPKPEAAEPAPRPRVPARAPRTRQAARAIGAGPAERDILDQYLYEVSKTPLLTAEQEIAVARRVRAGDQDAMQELVKRN